MNGNDWDDLWERLRCAAAIAIVRAGDDDACAELSARRSLAAVLDALDGDATDIRAWVMAAFDYGCEVGAAAARASAGMGAAVQD